MLRGCHRWSLRCNDTRRKMHMNRDGLLTGVKIACEGFRAVSLTRTGWTAAASGFVSSSEKLRHTCQDEPAEERPDVCIACTSGLALKDTDAQQIDAKSLNEAGVNVRLWRGWRVSYRTSTPEAETAEKACDRIARK